MKTRQYLNEDSLSLSAKNLQRFVGYFGFSLPLLLIIFTYIFDKYALPLESISHYYYTRAGIFFIFVVFAISLFLIFYKGESGSNKNDDWVTTAAAIMAILVLFFPTNNIDLITYPDMEVVEITQLKDNRLRSTSHLIFAGIFFVLLAYISYFRFPKIEKDLENELHKRQEVFPLNKEVNHVYFAQIQNFEEKRKTRNLIFKTCAIIIIASIVLLLVSFYVRDQGCSIKFNNFYSEYRITFFLEWVMIWAFAYSWFIKGKDYFGS